MNTEEALSTQLNPITKAAVEEYQCPGCVCGSDISCYEKSSIGMGCGKHVTGTIMFPIGTIALGMPKGFDRMGESMRSIEIFKDAGEFAYNNLNIPVWKYLDDNGNTLVRGLSPRINKPFLHVILGNRIKDIDCFELTSDFLETID